MPFEFTPCTELCKRSKSKRYATAPPAYQLLLGFTSLFSSSLGCTKNLTRLYTTVFFQSGSTLSCGSSLQVCTTVIALRPD